MTPDRAALLSRIEAFDIDGPDPGPLDFAARLAREHGWAPAFAARVVREYKRFVFLAMTHGRAVCPSEQVDAAWHLHLTYTRSYWKRFCGDVLGGPLHHDPTRGGPAEADKHLRMYADTLAAYREAFGREPPADVWPPAAVRFGDDLHHVAVNTKHNWVVSKAAVRKAGVVAAAVALVGVGCGADDNPFELKGVAFLTEFFWPLLIAAVILGLLIRWRMKGPAGGEAPALNWSDAAYLVGGDKRLLSAAVARAVQAGAAKVEDDGKLLNRGETAPEDPVLKAVWTHLPVAQKDFAKLKGLTAAVSQAFAERAAELQEQGLIFAPGRRRGIGFLTVLPLLVVALAFGLPRLAAGLAAGRPSGFLIASLVVSLFAFLLLLALTPRRTRLGDAAVAKVKDGNGPLKHGQAAAADESGYDAGLAVALFGTAALVGTPYSPLGTWYPRRSSEYGGGCGTGCGAGGSGCGGGDGGGGGGGCGGGGCGGCGGGGGD